AAAIDSGRLPAEEKLPMMEALASLAFKAKDYPESIRWSQRFLAEGGTSDSVRTMLLNAQFLSNDCAGVTKMLTAVVQEDAAAKRPTSETHWKMLAQCQRTLGDDAGYVRTLEHWVVQYPKKEVWADLIGRAAGRPGFAERLQLDLYRLMRATGTLESAEQFEHMAQLSLDAGYPAEARQVLEEGFTRERLGSGPNAQRQNRMRRTAEQKAASDTVGALDAMVPNVQTSVGLLNIGYAMTTLGEIDKGVKLMRQGIAKGGLKHPEDARLRLGAVLARAGRTEEAREVLSGVTGKDGTGDLARLWVAFAESGAGKDRK
ncbi:MAG TPA: hypothetical protein VFR86_16585, partial [Burkholderiaceae bacterium]|nr:hypothetical protein [Burkholderiaceae bacterium]